jgi:hypothetical protein
MGRAGLKGVWEGISSLVRPGSYFTDWNIAFNPAQTNCICPLFTGFFQQHK